MRFLSLFSGIEAASAAWLPLGWTCVAVAEIEPFPCKVLAHHYPEVPNLGDITKITKAQIQALGHIDLVVGGFPCQDLSIAGKRKGFTNDDGTTTRSGLFYTALRIAQWTNARWLLLENVPGIYSSNNGGDFASMVGEILDTEFAVPKNGWENSGVAISKTGMLEWVTLDAQYFGVPQRRRRMFALADFGDWRSRSPVLFEQHSLQGHIAPSRKAGKEVTEIAGTLAANGGGLDRPAGQGNELDFCVTVGALCARDYKGVGNQYVQEGKCIPTYTLAGNTIGRQPENGGNGNGYDESGVSYTLTKTDVHAVAYGVGESHDLAHCLRSGANRADKHTSTTYVAEPTMRVRRLMPMECERLQGFSDGFTNIPGASDSARYKALGNSMAVPVMAWIGQRIEMVERFNK